ncbi:MAG: DUF5979 domain-containing protein [Eubacteriales bacterium]|nr:DUF5979 domain-containing protein [Eubacteriales bacterium]
MKNMKKALAALLAGTMVMSMGMTAFAAETGTEFTFEKKYTTTAGNTPAKYPAEVLKFDVAVPTGYTNPDTTMILVNDHTVAGNPDNIVVTIPDYTKVGKYNYTVTEKEGNTQGVTYQGKNTVFGVQVLVSYKEDGKGGYTTELEKQVVFTTSDGTETGKIDGIVNYYDLGTLTVDKKVTGNLAHKDEKFTIHVEFKSTKPVLSEIEGVTNWTEKDGIYTSNKVTFNLSHNDDLATIINIPAGVTYTVEEDSKHFAEDPNGTSASTGYTATYSYKDGNEEDSDNTITADDTDAVEVLNTKGTTVDTGIDLDSIPYIMILGAAALGMGAFVAKKRKDEDLF